MLATLGSDPAIGGGWGRPSGTGGGASPPAGGTSRDSVITHLRLREPPTTLLDVDDVPGTVALVRRQVFERVGLLDEAYFFGGEMADLCHRARLCGFRSVTDPGARAQHDLDRSSETRQTLHRYYIVRNRFLFVRKHYPRRRACSTRGGS